MSLKIIKTLDECTGHLLVTHDGRFHPDEILGTVILFEAFNGNVSLLRTSNPPKYLKIPHVVYDVGHEIGYTRYDHHQLGGNGKRRNGVPYASAGLLWRDFGDIVLMNKSVPPDYINPIWKAIDNRLIQTVDCYDNGFLPAECSDFSINRVISNFNPTWLEQEASNVAFLTAFEVAKQIFNRELERVKAQKLAIPMVEAAIEESNDGIMILNSSVPWDGIVVNSSLPKAKEILYVITPSLRKGYNIVGVKKSSTSFEVRKPFPKSWAGLPKKLLREITGVETAHFCHSARFIAGAKTLEDAKKLAAIAANYPEELPELKEG